MAGQIDNTIFVENGELVWRLRGYRGSSSQHGKRGRGAHWRQASEGRKDQREAWQALLLAALRNNPEVEAWIAPKPVDVWIRVWGPSLPDSGNVSDQHKYAVDALVALGILVNDDPRHVPWTHAGSLHERPDWITRKTDRAVEIRLVAA